MDILTEDYIENEIIDSLQGADKSIIYKVFSNCTFNSCDFSNTNFSETTFEDCIFNDCNFSVSNFFQTKFRGVKFDGCKLLGLNFRKCDQFVIDFEFNNCLIQGCSFSDMKLNKIKFLKSSVIDCDFFDSFLSGADFSGCDLSETNFLHSDLRKANFKGAKKYIINPSANKIEKAIFSLPEAMSLLRDYKIIIK
ncbi:MAG: pentapeptide repeat-containing protein [Spirochaetaceae bacterium]